MYHVLRVHVHSNGSLPLVSHKTFWCFYTQNTAIWKDFTKDFRYRRYLLIIEAFIFISQGMLWLFSTTFRSFVFLSDDSKVEKTCVHNFPRKQTFTWYANNVFKFLLISLMFPTWKHYFGESNKATVKIIQKIIPSSTKQTQLVTQENNHTDSYSTISGYGRKSIEFSWHTEERVTLCLMLRAC